ncbi:MAG TPA: helix-turn-helix transcriptional regulator [Candidatus Nanoarchaeia archaeon]|nr:helix-turn-helix transcriptional regulator [Candidatus Nanoarchaeia archaeon]
MKKGLKSLGQKIKRIRKERGLLQVDLAVRVGISSSYVGSIEQGLRYPSLKVLEKIARVLRLPTSDLLANS